MVSEEYSEFRRLNLVNSEGRAYVWFLGGDAKRCRFVLICFASFLSRVYTVLTFLTNNGDWTLTAESCDAVFIAH